MSKFASFIRDLLRREEGASALEYALLAAMVAVVISLFVTPIGDQILSVMNQVLTSMGGTAVTR